LGDTLARFTGDVRPALQIFLPMDERSIADELDLENRGRARGSANQPASSDTGLDSVEREIISKVDEQQRQAYQTFTDEMRVYNDRMNSLDLENRVLEIITATKDAVSEFRSRVKTGQNQLYTLARNIKETETELEHFRSEHSLKRTAHYPDSLILLGGLLLIMIVVEAVLNGNFLAQGLAGGLVDGVLSALVIALLNVGIGCLFGNFARFVNHNAPAKRWIGYLSIGCQLFFILIFNLAVAHYRDALASNEPEEAVKLAVVLFKESPLGLQDFNSWILAAMGMFFSLIAFIDGYKWDDPYPGYGTTARKNDSAHANFNSEVEYLIEDLAETKDHAIETLTNALEDLNRRRREYLAVIQHQKRLCEAFNGYLGQLGKGLNLLLSIYRDTNKTHREEKAPKYFENAVPIQKIVNDVKPDEPPYNSQQITAFLKKAEKAISESRDELLSEYETGFSTFKDVEAIIQGGGDGSQADAQASKE
tara:strand:+ start:5187 stop:6623 length:1437 start_codon:yes stop_codon:yes gene_type:complete